MEAAEGQDALEQFKDWLMKIDSPGEEVRKAADAV